jgi:hypothetical protein
MLTFEGRILFGDFNEMATTLCITSLLHNLGISADLFFSRMGIPNGATIVVKKWDKVKLEEEQEQRCRE